MRISAGSTDRNRIGILYGALSYALWGVLPLYWKLLQSVPPIEILGHRIFWSFIFMALTVIIFGGRKGLFAAASNKKKLMMMFFCGSLISVNWFVYIMAVNTGQVIEASMGYFISPLVVVLLGVNVLKETLTRWQKTALVLAAAGVLIIAVQYGRIPWIALFLACSFALYGLIKKMIKVDPVTGLTLETFIVMPVALSFIIYLEAGGVGAVGSTSFLTVAILAGTGVVTAIPLLLYAKGIEKNTLSMMGFLQYIAPSINLFLGVVVFREYFSLFHLLSFSLIWTGLAIFTLANLGILKDPVLTNTELRSSSAVDPSQDITGETAIPK